MSREEAKQKIALHNTSIDDFINNDLAIKLNAKDGKIKMSQWVQAQTLINEQQFYEKGKKLQTELRELGFDVKMNMQDHKLVF